MLIITHRNVFICMATNQNVAATKMKCVVPENIHTPTMEGIGNSEGEGEGGGSKNQEIPEGRGVVCSI